MAQMLTQELIRKPPSISSLSPTHSGPLINLLNYGDNRGIHAGRSELMFISSSLSATSCSKTAVVAVDFPHDNSTWTSDIASNH